MSATEYLLIPPAINNKARKRPNKVRPVPKDIAIALLGGTVAEAANRIGVSKQAIYAWPDPLPDRVGDRVLAACVRWRIEQRRRHGVELEHWELALVS